MKDDNKGPGRPKLKVEMTRFETRVHVPQKQAWEAAAKAEGKPLASWLKSLADEAAGYKP